ncbi:unnamed protein product [Lasius platythorax]|uniref:Uncharacterized protein n=1 Tax=Lasius platythorax TaxID=488582 RepID=A0AAV2NQ84_9HYME
MENLRTMKVDRRNLLQPLIRQLENIPDTFLEIDYVNTFPSYAVILPEVNFSPRQAIDHMINRHKVVKLEIESRTDLLLRTVTYTYVPVASVIQFTFTNNMSLTEDILIICYLFHLLKTREYFAVKVIQDLYYMMRDKYHIQDDRMKHEDQRVITEFQITYSFPSVSFQWFGFDPNEDRSQHSFHFMYTTFPNLSLKRLYWNPMIASIIPRLKNSKFVPIALLTAISVKSNAVVKNPDVPNTELSLNAIYERILAFNSSEAFPEILKFKFCEMWGIVCKNEQRIYKYSDDFTKYDRVQEAINIISELKSQDPDLQTILSKIKLEI